MQRATLGRVRAAISGERARARAAAAARFPVSVLSRPLGFTRAACFYFVYRMYKKEAGGGAEPAYTRFPAFSRSRARKIASATLRASHTSAFRRKLTLAFAAVRTNWRRARHYAYNRNVTETCNLPNGASLLD